METTRLVHIARIRTGSEADLRRMVSERFPADEVGNAGIDDVKVFIGSTYLLTEYAFSGEYTPIFTALQKNQTVSGFMDELGRMLDDEPLPRPDATAAQTLASQALAWSKDGTREGTPHVRSKDGSSDRS